MTLGAPRIRAKIALGPEAAYKAEDKIMTGMVRAVFAAAAFLSLVLVQACAGSGGESEACNGISDRNTSLNDVIAGCTALIAANDTVPVAKAAAYDNRGLAYDARGDDTRAIADYDAAIKLNPNSAHAFNNRGNAYRALGRDARAIEDYDEAIRLKPDYAHAFNNRGTAYGDLRQYARAIEDFDGAIKLKPDYAFAFNGRCWVRAVEGRKLDLALADCNEALRIAPSYVGVLGSRGLVLFKMHKYAEAIADCNSALALDPKLAAPLYIRGVAKLKSGDGSGNTDIGIARAVDRKIASTYAGYGVAP